MKNEISSNEYIGKKYGRLTVIKLTHFKKKWYFECKCECGGKKVVGRDNLIYGHTKSCGCYKRDYLRKKHITHGLSKTKLYGVWETMKNRCYNPNSTKYKRYGARGILVCDEWKNNFEAFYNWAVLTGYKKGLTIERINNNGNYEPSNCRWLTNKEQANNKSTNKYITYNGQTKTLAEWCNVFNVPYSLFRGRLRLGWSIEKTFFTPRRK